MKKIGAIILLLSFHSIVLPASHDRRSTYKLGDCKNTEAELKTQVTKNPIRILFWEHHRYKVKTVDNILDSKSGLILKATSYSIWSEDAGDFVKFNRIQIKENKIYEYKFWLKSKHGKIITYNLCGERISKERLPMDEIWDRFHRNMYNE